MLHPIAVLNFGSLFRPDESIIETFVRGSVTYLTIFLLMRVVLKRGAGGVNLPDLLVVVLVADAAQNAMAGTYTSVTSGLVLVATIGGWAYALDWMAFRSRFFAQLVHPQPIELVKDGKILRHNLRKELILEAELMTSIRDAGGEDVASVRRAYLEGNGEISIILNEGVTASSSKTLIG